MSNSELEPVARHSFDDPNVALRFRDLIKEFVDQRLNSQLEIDRHGYILDITEDGPEYPSAVIEHSPGVDAQGNPTSTEVVPNTLDNPKRASYAKIITDDGFLIRARISPLQMPVFRKAEFFDKSNPSGEGVMIDERGIYVYVTREYGFSVIHPTNYPWLSFSNGERVVTEPQVAPRAHISGRAGQYYVVSVTRGVVQPRLDLELAKRDIIKNVADLQQAKADLEAAATDLVLAQADLDQVKYDLTEANIAIQASMTEAAQAKAEALLATGLASTASQEAGDAQDTATQALVSANGKNNIVRSTGDATGTTNPDTDLPNVKGDIWRKHDAQENVIAEWGWDGTTWKAQAITSEMVTNFDVHKLTVSGTARIIKAVLDKVFADAAYFGSLTTDHLTAGDGNINSLVSQKFATALASIIEARIENLTTSGTANINTAVIQKLAAQVVDSGEFKTLINPVNGVYTIMDNNGIRIIDSDGSPGGDGDPVTLINLGPVGDMLLQLGTGQSSASIDGAGNVTAMRGSFQELWVGGNLILDNINSVPRGIMSWGELAQGRYSRQLQARDQILGLESTLQGGRVYKLTTNNFVCGSTNNNAVPALWMHYTLDGSYPGANWTASRKSESTNGPFAGQWKAYAPMTVFIDLRHISASETRWLRAGVTLGDNANIAPCQVSALFGPAMIWVEDMGTNFANRGGPYYDTGGQQPIRTRQVQRWFADNWATYFRSNNTRDTTSSKPTQGQYSSYNRIGAFFFPSITAALSGATIFRITLHSFADHWYYSGGGTAAWCWHGHTGAIPSTMPAHYFMVDTPGWPRGAAREINLISSEFGAWQSGARRGFCFATPSTTYEYYGSFSTNLGATWIEVDYEK